MCSVGTRAMARAGHLLNFPVRNYEIRREREFARYQQKCWMAALSFYVFSTYRENIPENRKVR